MATVFLANDVKHDREVAIKVLHPELAASLGGERFEREIRLAAKLQHPHILGLHDSGVAGDLLYYVMPFVKGESLRDKIDREGMLPVEEAVGITLEVSGGLGYAHSKGVVHRDIKPENILLSEGHALIADFGIARAISNEGQAQKLTATGMSMGTPYYMAPEQASGETVGPSADIYSLGCMLYEMLAGEPPFTGKNSMQIMARHAMEQVPSIRIVRSSVPEEVEQAIFAAMGKVPADRPQTCAQFSEILGLPMGVTSTMRTRTYSAARRTGSGAQYVVAQRPWWRHPAAIAAAVVVVAAGGFGYWKFGRPQRAAALGPDSRRIAVLYFEDQSKDHTLGPLADGLTEGLIHTLSNAPSLTVIPRDGVERYRGSSVTTDSIAKVLRAGYLVRGEVEPAGKQVKVSLRLLDGASGVNLRSSSVVISADSVSAMREKLTTATSDLIRKQLGSEIQVKEERAGTENSDAWLLLQRGQARQKNGETANSKGDTAGFNKEFLAADSLYAAAQALDSKWAEPATMRAGLAYRRSRLSAGKPDLIRKWIDTGLGLADQAVANDANNADAYEVRGNLRYWSWVAAIETDATKRESALLSAKADLEKSTSLNRNQAGAYATLSHLYYQIPSATPSDIYIAAQRALEADEFLSNANVIYSRLFLAAYDLAQFDKAEQWCTAARQRFPDDQKAVKCRLFLLTTKSDPASVALAWKIADSAVAMLPPAQQPRERLTEDMLVAAVIAQASKAQPNLADSARHVARRSEGTPAIDPVRDATWFGAWVYTLLGDKEEAIRLLKQYLAANPQRTASLRADPGWYFRDLEKDPRYRQAVGAP
jgi:serine/threonine-protein kinase